MYFSFDADIIIDANRNIKAKEDLILQFGR